jgi:hypothetical protein
MAAGVLIAHRAESFPEQDRTHESHTASNASRRRTHWCACIGRPGIAGARTGKRRRPRQEAFQPDGGADQWGVPLNVLVSKLTKIDSQLISVGGGVRHWADGPDSGPHGWGLRLVVTFLFPK